MPSPPLSYLGNGSEVRSVAKGSCQSFSAPSPPLGEGEEGQEPVLVGSWLPLLQRGAASSLPSPLLPSGCQPLPTRPQTPAAASLQL